MSGLRFAPPEPEPEGLGIGAFVLALLVIGVIALVALEAPGSAMFIGLVGLAVLASFGGET